MPLGKTAAAWLLLVLGLSAGALAAAQGRRGAVTVKFPGGGAPAKAIRQVAIVSADTLEVLETVSLGRKRQIVLRPAPGVLFAAATDVAVRSARSGVSRVFLVDPEHAASAPIRTRRAAPDTLQGAAAAAKAGVTAATGGGGNVLTMGSIPVTSGGPIGSIGHGLLTGVFNPTHDGGARWVTSDAKVIETRERYLELQAEGRLDPSTPIRDELLTPTTRIEGELSWADGHLSGEIRIVDPRTGEVIDRIPVDRDFDRDSLDDLRKLLGDLTDDLIRKILDLLPTTTTTSTSTTTTTTTTTTTIETTTTTTTTTTTIPTTTIPTTTTTSSSTTTTVVPCGTGLLASAEVYTFDFASVWAVKGAPPPPESQSSTHPANPPAVPIIQPVGESRASGGDEWDLTAIASTARADSGATVSWTITPCGITASGTFHEKSTGGGTDKEAIATIEARHRITLKVKQQAPYTITGYVRAAAAPSTAPPTNEFLKCESTFGIADANLQSPSGAQVAFSKESFLHPSEELTIQCAVVRGATSSALEPGTDEANLEWSYTITLGN